MAATVRISRIEAKSADPATVRISGIHASTDAPAATVRLSRVSITNSAQGDAYVLRAGVWQPHTLQVRVAGAWVVI